MPRSTMLLCLLLLAFFGCGKTADQQSSSSPKAGSSFFGSKQVTIPAGTVLTVRLGQALGSKFSNSGESFNAALVQPVEVDGKVVLPTGSPASGHVVEAVSEGRFKGGAILRLTLDTVTVDGTKYDLQTSSVTRTLKGKGKRTAAMVGGGAGAGALIGGLAGGGKGALIGAALGAGAGTAGAAYTGNRNIVIPAESALSFKLIQPIVAKL